MMRAFVLALFLAACGGARQTAPPAGSPDATALIVKVNYADNGIDRLHVTGVALAKVRPFGPYDITDSRKVRSGATIALLFDPSDEGSAMVCVQALDGNTTMASACGTFRITANETNEVELDLDANH